MILAVVDRIESGVAVLELEDGAVIMVPPDELPPGVAEGDLLQVTLGRAPRGSVVPPPKASG